MRLGIFDIGIPPPPGVGGRAVVDLDSCLRHLVAAPVVIPPVTIVDRYGGAWMGHLTAPASDLQRIIGILQNRDSYTLGDRIKKFFGCGIGARAEKYLGDYFGFATKRYLHKLNDGRLNCLLAALANEENVQLLEELVRDMATHNSFAGTRGWHPYTIFLAALSPADKGIIQSFCANGHRGRAKGLDWLAGMVNAGELGRVFTARDIAAQAHNYPTFTAALLERMVIDAGLRPEALEPLNELADAFDHRVAFRAAVGRLVPIIADLLTGVPLVVVDLRQQRRFLDLLDRVAADRTNANQAEAERLLAQPRLAALRARLAPPPPPIPPPIVPAPVGHDGGYVRPPPPRWAAPRMSGMTYEEERQVLEAEMRAFAAGPVDLVRLLMPPDEDRVMAPFEPREDLSGDYSPAWAPGGYSAKLAGIIRALPDSVLGDDPAGTRQSLLDGLVLNGRRDFAFQGCWFEKTMRTAECRNPEARTRLRRQIATGINCLEQLQREGRNAEVLKVLQSVDFFSSACPDRASVGINTLSLQTRLLAKQHGETDPDRRALMTMKELIQQVKITFVGATLMARHAHAGEGIEGLLLACIMLKDVLGLPFNANEMLYRGCGLGALGLRDAGPDGIRRFFRDSLRQILTRLSTPEEFLAFFATPPADAQLGDQHWETISTAPFAQLSDPGTTEGVRSRLLVGLITPILQGLGYLWTDPPAQLIGRANAHEAEAIRILYWRKLDGDGEASWPSKGFR